MSSEDYKRQAAEAALAYVETGMRLGLGTGSTAAHFVTLLGRRVAEGLDCICVPTSEATRKQAAGLNIRLATLDEEPMLDLTIDGADEIDSELRLIKGGGGALLREKIVAVASERLLIIADHTKLVDKLGRFPLPIEVVPFGLKATQQLIVDLAADVGCDGPIRLRKGVDGKPFVTDNGNHILDCSFTELDDAEALEDALSLVPGIVETGLFIGIADRALVAGPGGVSLLESNDPFEQES